jgi:methyl-accepting chemotaxis protein
MSPIISAIFDFNHPTNFYAFLVLILLFCLALVGTFSKSERLTKYAKQSPSILATVGVCFSFFGIATSLISLNLTDIQHSIPNLLDGLKIKFIASLMGIFLSTVIKFIQSFVLENKDTITIDSNQEIINLLTKIDKSLVENNKNNPEQLLKELKETIAILPVEFKKQSGLLEAIKTSLVGDGDASVTTQLLKVRETIRDGLDNSDKKNKQYFDDLNNNNKQYLGTISKNIKEGFESQNTVLNSSFNDLTIKFDEFARVLAENNSKVFIEALEKAMRDFNNNITEQFGENFKQLNEAVGQLLIWQGNYKTHVEQLTDNFKTALISIETINTAFGEIKNRSESFTATSEQLHGILTSLDRQLKDLTNHLQAFDELSANAKTAFPIIENNINKLTTGFKNSTEQSLSDIRLVSTIKNNQLAR